MVQSWILSCALGILTDLIYIPPSQPLHYFKLQQKLEPSQVDSLTSMVLKFMKVLAGSVAQLNRVLNWLIFSGEFQMVWFIFFTTLVRLAKLVASFEFFTTFTQYGKIYYVLSHLFKPSWQQGLPNLQSLS